MTNAKPETISRRALLMRATLAAGAAYVAPTLVGLDVARASGASGGGSAPSVASAPSAPSRPSSNRSAPSRPSSNRSATQSRQRPLSANPLEHFISRLTR